MEAASMNKAKEQHSSTEFFVRTILDELPQPVFWKDTHSVYLGCNTSFALLAGLESPQEIVGLTDHDLAWKNDNVDEYIAADCRVIDGDLTELRYTGCTLTENDEEHWWEVCKTALHGVNGAVIGVIGTYTEITDTFHMQNKLAHNLRFEELVVSLTHRFVHASPEKLKSEIDFALEELARFIGVDRSYLALYSSYSNCEVNAFEWTTPELTQSIDNSKLCDFDNFPWWNDLAKARQGFSFSSVDELPDYACRERIFYENSGIKSNMEIVIEAEGQLYGFLGFETLIEEKIWTEDDRQILTVFGEILGGTLRRQKIQQSLNARLQIDEAMISISSLFLDARSAAVDELINASLGRIAKIINANRGYVYRYDMKADRIFISHEWSAIDVPQKGEMIPKENYASYSWWSELDKTHSFVMFSSLDELPEYAYKEKKFYQEAKIFSNIDIRLTYGDEYLGSLGFDSYGAETTWEIDSAKPIQLLAEIISGALKRQEYESHIDRKTGLEQVLLDISTKFIQLPTDDFHQSINDTLQLLGQALDVDRCYFDSYDEKNNEEISAYEWINPSEKERPWHNYEICLDNFPYWNAQKDSHEEIVFNSLDDMPPEASAEREFQKKVGVKSFLELNLVIDNSLHGFLGMETSRHEKTWCEDDLRTMRTASKIICGALARMGAENKLRRRRKAETLQLELHNLLFTANGENFDEAITQALAIAAEYYEAEHAYIHGIQPITKEYVATYTWHADSVSPINVMPPVLAARDYIWWEEKFHAHQPICFSSVTDVPSYAIQELRFYDKTGAKSNLDLDFSFGIYDEAYIGFNTFNYEKRWDDDDIPLLRILADIFSNALTRRETEEALATSNERLIEAQEIGHIGIWEIDETFGKTIWSDEVYRIFGYRPGQAKPGISLLRKHFNKDEFLKLEEFLKKTIRVDGRGELDLRCKNKRGENRYVYFTGKLVKGRDKKVVKLRGTVQDITDRKMVEEQLHYMSYHDILTGLSNRAYFEQKIIEFSRDSFLPLSIVSGDVNGLKIINDTFGHQQGDLLLITMADILKRTCRETDVACRWGGDEFCVLLPHTDSAEAEMLASRIKSECEKVKHLPFPLSISFGISSRLDTSIHILDLLKEVEDKMYQNKLLESSSARNSVIVSLQETLAEKTFETEEHSQRLQEYAKPLGEAVNLTSNEMNNLMVLATLHDIGKIAVPEHILMKPGKLDEKEWEIVKKHPETGFRIAQATPELSKIADTILSHHERWDGKGYPQGLAGTNIPLNSRIISLADTFDVMVHGRPYKGPASWESALQEIENCSGSQFDPELAQLFCQTMRERIAQEGLA
jgi:diguanylate cyclase (GGDEF)-like protein/PAS domain S-box-containing protein